MPFLAVPGDFSGRRRGVGCGGNTGDCVEVAFGPGGSLLRDSKNTERVLAAGSAAFAALIRSVAR